MPGAKRGDNSCALHYYVAMDPRGQRATRCDACSHYGHLGVGIEG